jgi:alpha-tubulin suppressor-like RCC1 family protein
MGHTTIGRVRAVTAVAGLAGLASVLITARAVPAAAAPALAPASVFAWGANWEGEVLGYLTPTQSGGPGGPPTPVQFALPASPVQVAAGGEGPGAPGNTSAAVLANGTLAMWGDDRNGQLGDTRVTGPGLVIVPGLSNITQVSVRGGHVLALDSSGTVWSWGSNLFGELGDRATGGSHPTPVPVPFLNQIVQVSAGIGYSLALRSDGTVWAFGANGGGQLGDGTTASRNSAERVPGLGGITKVMAGEGTSYAIGAGGVLLAWGSNANGLLGNGTTTGQSLTPVAVPGLTGVTSVATSTSETLAAVGPAGTMWSWGPNSDGYGSTGNGTTTPNYTPQPTSLTGVKQLAASDLNGAAVLANGTLMTWGVNNGGQLGNGSKDNFPPPPHPTPGPVRSLAGVTQVALSDNSALAIGSPAPRVPSVIGQSQSEAAQTLQAAGFVLGRVATVVDITCEYLGEVKSQSPAAGTFDPPGTSVNIAIGKAGGKCL